jgi:UDP-N-acetylglucosamine 4,6-dehydratase
MRVAITGGTGTLGRALIPRLLKDGAERVVTVSRDEVKAGDVAAEFNHPNLRTFLGDIRDQDRLVQAFAGCDTVIHAAALKRVTESAYSPGELIKTNIQGTVNVIEAAREAGVSRLLVISSDKAVHATNLYGSTKFTAECYAVQANSYTVPQGLRVACTRYGNVLGSRGSVTEVWASLPREAPIPLTSAAMSRFMITKPQAVQFILDSLETMRGGEVFIPILPSFTIIDLALALYDSKRKLDFVGLRPGGEKIYEQLVSDEEWARLYRVEHGAVVLPSFKTWDDVQWALTPVFRKNYESAFRSDLAPRLTVEEIRDRCHFITS